jgi:polyphosphate kinase
VLAEASNAANPPLERCRFLSIFESNLDEFYWCACRASWSRSRASRNVARRLGPSEQLARIAETVGPMRRVANDLWTRELAPLLAEAGVEILPWNALTGRRQADLRRWFEQEVFRSAPRSSSIRRRRCRSSRTAA